MKRRELDPDTLVLPLRARVRGRGRLEAGPLDCSPAARRRFRRASVTSPTH